MATWRLAQGFAGSWTVTLRDGNDQVVTTYTGAEPLAGAVWAGDGRLPLVDLLPVWLNPAAGQLTVPIAPADSAALEPALYRVEVYPADFSANFYRGSLEVLPAPGTEPTPFSYVTYDQMLMFAGQAGRLQDLDADEAQFAAQRAQASQDFDRLVLNRYEPQPGRSMRYVSADGTTAGPYLRWSVGPAGEDAPGRAVLAGLLGSAAVILNADAVECVAQLALGQIYLGQPGRDNPYRDAGLAHRAAALEAFRRAFVEVDADGDGVADYRVDQDVVWYT
jgi:hypothetical protein